MDMTGMLETAAGWLWDNFLWLNVALIILLIFFERREPKTVWAWMLALYFLPAAGILLYLLVGQDLRRKRTFRLKGMEEEFAWAMKRQEELLGISGGGLLEGEAEGFAGLIRYNLEAARAVLTVDNSVNIITDGRELYADMIREMGSAKEYIHVQSYIIRPDEIFQEMEICLAKKCSEGVKVRLLADAIGSRGMRRSDFERLKDIGILAERFFPPRFGRLPVRLNYRNHRKITVIDGRVAYVGGFNFGREYMGLDEKLGFWRDTHLKIKGSAVLALNMRFIQDWNYAAKEDLFREKGLLRPQTACCQGESLIQIISSGPDSKWQNIRSNYLRLIHLSRDHLYIQTPYFIPDETILEALRTAALSGVKVRIMVPSIPDHPFVLWATRSYIGDMLEAGARCYLYRRGFLHSKCVMSDGLVYCCGTANMDIRSFQLNFEVNAVVYDRKSACRMEKLFEEDLKDCVELTAEEYRGRGVSIRVKEQFCRLLSPLL